MPDPWFSPSPGSLDLTGRRWPSRLSSADSRLMVLRPSLIRRPNLHLLNGLVQLQSRRVKSFPAVLLFVPLQEFDRLRNQPLNFVEFRSHSHLDLPLAIDKRPQRRSATKRPLSSVRSRNRTPVRAPSRSEMRPVNPKQTSVLLSAPETSPRAPALQVRHAFLVPFGRRLIRSPKST